MPIGFAERADAFTQESSQSHALTIGNAVCAEAPETGEMDPPLVPLEQSNPQGDSARKRM